MVTKIYAVYDCKVGAYLAPFFMPSEGAALRAWGDSVQDPQTQFNRHPGDFTLFEIGQWDEQTGEIGSYEIKRNLGTALEALSQLRSSGSMTAQYSPGSLSPLESSLAENGITIKEAQQ